MSTRPAAVVVLAAGEGTRMRSATPKVLHSLGGRSLLGHAVTTAGALDPEHLVVVVGHGRDQVEQHLTEASPGTRTAVQEQRLGTGDAVRCALEALPQMSGTVVVTYGDVPLLTAETVRGLLQRHEDDGNAVTVLTSDVPDPTGYGRIVRADSGAVAGIVEHADADDRQRAITEINSGIYAFDAAVLADGLSRITTDNTQGELYLTDVLGIARNDGGRVGAEQIADTWQTEGVNDRVQLAQLGAELNRRVVLSWMRAGVTVLDPATTWIDVQVQLERDVLLRPGVQLHGATSVAEGAEIGPDTTVTDCEVQAEATVVRSQVTGAHIGPRATVGPFSYLRPETVLGAGAKVGAYVEVKSATIGPDSKAPHLSYIGDAQVGTGTNLGAAMVTVNYDGQSKHPTVVGDHVRIGSDTMLVAPVTIGDGSYTAAGSVITEDVPAGSLAIARGRQRNVEDWVPKRRPGTPAAQAAEAAQRDQGPSNHPDSSGRSETSDNHGERESTT